MQKMELRYWCGQGNKKNKNKLTEWKVFVDSVGIKSADLPEKFYFLERLFELPICREKPQTAICWLEWLGRLKCLATGWDASLLFLSTWFLSTRTPSRRRKTLIWGNTKSLWRRTNARNVSYFTLCGGQFTFSTQLLTLNYLLYSPTDATPQFL